MRVAFFSLSDYVVGSADQPMIVNKDTDLITKLKSNKHSQKNKDTVLLPTRHNAYPIQNKRSTLISLPHILISSYRSNR